MERFRQTESVADLPLQKSPSGNTPTVFAVSTGTADNSRKVNVRQLFRQLGISMTIVNRIFSTVLKLLCAKAQNYSVSCILSHFPDKT